MISAGAYILGLDTPDGERAGLKVTPAGKADQHCIAASTADGKRAAVRMTRMNKADQHGIVAVSADSRRMAVRPPSGGIVAWASEAGILKVAMLSIADGSEEWISEDGYLRPFCRRKSPDGMVVVNRITAPYAALWLDEDGITHHESTALTLLFQAHDIDDDGNVFCFSSGRDASQNNLFCFDAAGTLVWSQPYNIGFSPTQLRLFNGYVYVCGPGGLEKRDPSDGSLIWRQTDYTKKWFACRTLDGVNQIVTSRTVLSPGDAAVYLEVKDEDFNGIMSNVIHYTADPLAYCTGDAGDGGIVAGYNVNPGGGPANDAPLVRILDDGSLGWTFMPDEATGKATCFIGSEAYDAGVALLGNYYYVGGGTTTPLHGYVWKVNAADGTQAAMTDLGENKQGVGCVESDGVILVGIVDSIDATTGGIRAYDADLNELWAWTSYTNHRVLIME